MPSSGTAGWYGRFISSFLRNGDADVEHEFVDTVGEGEGGMNGESGIDIYTVSCVKQVACGNLQYNTGSSAQLCKDLEGWGGDSEGGSREREHA